MKYSSVIIFFISLFYFSSLAPARVFEMGSETFASYLKMDYGPASFSDKPYSLSSGNDLSFSKSYSTLSAYEFGFLFVKKQLGLKIGLQVIKPSLLKDISGTDASGTEMYTIKSDLSVASPVVGLQMNLKNWPTARLFMLVNYGQGTLTLTNDYVFSTSGSTAFSLTDFKEEIKSTAYLTEFTLGAEQLMFDTTTIVIELGYRSLKFTSLTHNLPLTNSFQGAVTSGTVATDNSGNPRNLDFSGVFASVSFRFWIF